MRTYNFYIVNEFECFGILLTHKNDLRCEVNRRFGIANKAYYTLLPILKSNSVFKMYQIQGI